MKKLMLHWLLLLGSLSASGQNLLESRQTSVYTYIYQLKEKEAEKIYQESDFKIIDTTFFHTLIDSFPTDSINEVQQKLAPGYYLKALAKENQLKFYFTAVHDFEVQIVDNNTDLCVQVYDSVGQIISNANVIVGRKYLKYDSKTQTYRHRKSNKKGLLKIEYEGKTAYYELERKYNNSRWRRTSRKVLYRPPLRYIWLPVRYVVRLPIDGVKSIKHRNKFGVIYSTSRFFNNFKKNVVYFLNNGRFPKKKKTPEYNGYFIFNKPKYLPGDTVKLKAFVVDEKGKALKEPLRLRLGNYSTGKLLGTLDPYRDGGYTFEFVLHDSLRLRLDRRYYLRLEKEVGHPVMVGNFRYEDYELGKVKLAVRTEEDKQYRGKDFAIHLKGTDENELNLLDARAEIFIKNVYVRRYWPDSIFIPDTLFYTEVQLEPDGETEVIIPDSLMPQANFSYTAYITLRTSDNEQVFESKTISFYDRRQFFDFSVEGDSVRVAFQEDGVEQTRMATIYENDNFGNRQEVKKAELPCYVALNPYFNNLSVHSGDLEGRLPISEELSLVRCYSNRTRDSLEVIIENPRKISFAYFLYQKNKEILRGFTDSLHLLKKINTQQKMMLSLHYLWGGKMVNANYRIEYLDKQLKVEMIHPQLVYPGQNTPIKILVTDQEGAPVPDVDLSAFAWTKKFDYSVAPVPYLGKKKKGKSVINNFKLEQVDLGKRSEILLPYATWRKQAGLDSLEYYQFLYPGNQLYQFDYTAPDSQTQFAPFAVSRGEILPIHVIYVDNRPVYFSWSTNTQPYSFPISPGFHQIELRTTDHWIVMDSLYFPASQKMVFSLDVNHPYPEVKISNVKKELSKSEKNNLHPYIFPYRNNFGEHLAYIEQGGQIQFLQPKAGRRSNSYLAGPVVQQQIEFHLLDSFSTRFLHEPHFEYEFRPGILKMRTGKNFPTWLNSYPARKAINQTAIGLSDIQRIWKEYKEQKRYNLAYYSNPSNNKNSRTYGSLQVDYGSKPERPMPLNVLLLRYDTPTFTRVYPGRTSVFRQLEAGEYQVIFFYPDAKYHRVDSLNVQVNGLTCYRLPEPDTLQQDSFSIRVSQLIEATIFKPRTSGRGQQTLKKIQKVYQEEFTFTGEGPIIEGFIRDENGEGLIGATLVVKGTTYGTVTDVDGHYSIKVPRFSKELEVSYLGFTTATFDLSTVYSNDFVLEENNEILLNEVVVVGYRVPLVEQDNTTSGGIITSAQIRNLPSKDITALAATSAGLSITDGGDDISVRGSRSDGTSYYIDGIRVSGLGTQIPAQDIANVEVLSSEEARTRYGLKSENGVVLITTKTKSFGGAEFDEIFMEAAGSSRSIRENFSDYAFWKPQLKTDARGEAEFTVTFPDDVTSWETYAMAMNGKRQSGEVKGFVKSYKPLMAQLATPRFLIEGDSTLVIGKTLNYTTDTLQATTFFKKGDQTILERKRDFVHSILDTVAIVATGADTIHLQYSLEKDDGYFDGEKRSVPQFPKGMEETEGQFFVLDQDTSIRLSFAENLGEVTLYAQANLLKVLEEEISYLNRYKYFCNEQLASKLKALLVQQSIQKFKKEPFKGEKNIRKIIRQLEKNQNHRTGLWGWWNREGRSYWISYHIIEALLEAKKRGYPIKWNTRQLIDKMVWELEGNALYTDKLRMLYLLNVLEAKVDFRRYLDALELPEETSLYHRLQLMELKQICLSEFNRDSLQGFQQETMLGSIYFADEEEELHLHQNPIQNTLMAYRMLQRDSLPPKIVLRKMRNYFLENRRTGYWRNTYESSKIIETIAKDLLDGKEEIALPKLQLNGAITKSIQNFPYETKLQASDQLTVSKTGDYPVYLTAYQHYWNKTPEAKSADFHINTHFVQKDSSDILKAGERVKLQVVLEVLKDADYVQIEVPIPAGCSYGTKRKNHWQEVHREYFKNETALFCKKLDKGTYRFDIELIPRYSGKYSMNPAKVELMYFPTFNANTALKEIRIE